MKSTIGLGCQVAKAMMSIVNDSPIKPKASEEATLKDLKWILGLIKSGEFKGYITTRTLDEIVEMFNREIGSDQDRYKEVVNILKSHNIHTHSFQKKQSDSSDSNYLNSEIEEYLSLAFDLDLDIFIARHLEMFETRFSIDYFLYSKLKTWVLTPSRFTKLIKFQNMHLSRSSGWKYSFRDILTLKEVEELHRFETDVLPQDTALAENNLKTWWQCYNPGIKAIFLGKKIIGILSLWSLSEATAKNLKTAVKNGTFTESQLDIFPYEDGRECKYWYIGGFYLHENLRSKGLSEGFADDLLMKSLTLWRAGGEKAFRPSPENGVEILAIPVNPYAETILKKRGFQQEQGTTHDGFPLYIKTINSTYDLISLLRISD